MSLFLQTLVSQLPIACVYALIGVGFVTIYKSTGVLNFAQGFFGLMGGYLDYQLNKSWGLPVWLAIVLTVVLASVVGAAIFLGMLRPLLGEPPLRLVMLTIAISIVLSAAGAMVFGSTTKYLASPLGGELRLPLHVTISHFNVAIVVATVVVLGALGIALRLTPFGLAMRAASGEPLLATYRGINVVAVGAVSWAVAVGCAAMAGIAYGSSVGVYAGTADILGFAAFPAVVVGGIDSVPGVLIGAVILAEAQGITGTYMGGAYSEVVGYALLLLILLIRPTGLLGTRAIVRL